MGSLLTFKHGFCYVFAVRIRILAIVQIALHVGDCHVEPELMQLVCERLPFHVFSPSSKSIELLDLLQVPPKRLLRIHLSEHPIALHLVDGLRRDADVHGHVPRLPRPVDACDCLLGEFSRPAW